MANRFSARTSLFVKKRFSALPSQVIQENAAEHGTRHGHRRVQRHPEIVSYRELNQQSIVDDRKTEHGGIQKGNQQQPWRAERGGEGYHFFFPRVQRQSQSATSLSRNSFEL